MATRLRAVQVSFYADEQRRDAAKLLSAWPTLVLTAAAAARAGVEILVVQASHKHHTLDRDGVTFEFVDDTRAVPIRLAPGVRIPRRPSRIIDRVVALTPDVVHVHGLNYPFAIRQLTSALGRVPVLVQDHGSIAPTGWRRAAHRWAYRSLAGVAFTAREQAGPFVEAGALDAALPVFEVIGGSSAFTPGDRDDARRATGMCGDPCVLWTGRLDANKDPLTMLAAFDLAARHLPEARLWCCFGTAPLLDVVKRCIAASPVLRERATLVGPRAHADMEHYFRSADFYVQTSHREASGFSLLEALACGTTPLVTDIPAARRIVGTAGSLTPVGDAGALARAMVEWSGRDPVLRRRKARERFEGALTFDVIGHELRHAYESLIGSR